MEYMKLKEYWLSEEKKIFEGWDFSYIAERKSEEPLPWNYDKMVHQYLSTNSILLDMGTGGGEHLLTLKHPYNNTFATEAYQPNFELCKKTLTPLGIGVRQVFNDNYLPFENDMFDVIINRQASFDMNEVYRLLKPNGLFITQQVGELNNKELRRFLISDFNETNANEHTLKSNLGLIRSKGFTILKADECFPKQRFWDVGALVYYARIIEWEFPKFSVDSCFNQLCQLQSIVEQKGFVESKQHRFVIVAQKLNHIN
ncbi:class I SAM-dependent methyltransferase [Clostridium estertheticum]|uniref:class I SAM-dependent methyltransferase n=1 Tax=Clostridium estertheticum TaxID=238834 RepID=UPI001CF19B94|nr:class I SAM-dependent methyltransferase [Clostridium estertheticum]MCB2306634.1 class I SAM-dependent methyltransferase [Clostridium estertheticum]MCB2345222.1 class I SAM-dependent methyltransferase [Clostridium estertheticum]MCB2350004.1 class I SAM-dependent methyltransferase [Clostridium estertheticum]WAG44399.1 class I SAM-dependent methyltransferase [Clostridium estertheticum]